MIWLLAGYMWLFIHRPFEVWAAVGTLQIERAYAVVMLLVWLVAPGKGLVSNRIHWCLGFFALMILVTWTASPYASTLGCMEVVENYFKVAFFYVLVVTTVRTERDLRTIVLLYLVAVGLYMSHSLLEYMNGRYEYRMGIRRMVGVDITYRDPNAFSSGLLFALPLTIPFWLERPRRVPRYILLGFTGMACLCILLTGSRAAFLGTLLLGVVAIMMFARRKLQALVLVGVAGVLFFGALAIALPDQLQTRYLTIIDPSYGPKNAQESAEGRTEGFKAGVELFQKSPLVGQGPGSFLLASKLGMQPHNLYGQVMAEMGMAGIIALGGLCLCFVLNWVETRRLQAHLRALTPRWNDPVVDVRPTWETPSTAYQVSRAVMITLMMLLLLGLGGHNLYRFHWQWFAAFQAIAVGCLRVRVQNAQWAAAYAAPSLIPPRAQRSIGRSEVPPTPRW
jgi:O-antigen ligase